MTIGVVGNPRYESLSELLARVAALATRHHVTLLSESELASQWPAPVGSLDAQSSLDLLLTLGGDGTLLRGARALNGRSVPILGINLGRVGFLTTSPPADLEKAIETFLNGEHVIDSRRTLSSTITGPTGARDGAIVLNDLVVHKAGVARVERFRIAVDGDEVGHYSVDGIIVATPTGSTAYSLSAGGPIVVPGVDALVVTAICPHTLAVRPIVVSGLSEIMIERLPPYGEDVLVSYDGQVGTTLEAGGSVCIRRSPSPVQLVRLGKERFFARVRKKLQWGDLSDRERG